MGLIFYSFHPDPSGNDPIWRSHSFQMGWNSTTTQIYLYIYIYIYLEPVCPLFWGLDPPKQGPFQAKQGAPFGFQVTLYRLLRFSRHMLNWWCFAQIFRGDLKLENWLFEKQGGPAKKSDPAGWLKEKTWETIGFPWWGLIEPLFLGWYR